MLDFSYEEAKLQLVGLLSSLDSLEEKRKRLNEQLFFLDMQLKVSNIQYKKILFKIAEHQRRQIKPPPLFQMPFKNELPSLSCEEEKIEILRQKLLQYQCEFTEKKNVYFLLTKQKEVINELTKGIVNEDVKQIESDNFSSIQNIVEKLNEQRSRKRKLLQKKEKYLKNVRFSLKIEKLMQIQLGQLLENSDFFVRQQKWHPTQAVCSQLQTQSKIFFHSNFSIP